MEIRSANRIKIWVAVAVAVALFVLLLVKNAMDHSVSGVKQVMAMGEKGACFFDRQSLPEPQPLNGHNQEEHEERMKTHRRREERSVGTL